MNAPTDDTPRPARSRRSTAVVGLTGGIACGKSTVAEVLRELGVRVIDADELAREVTRPGEPALEALVKAFGGDILTRDGELDRKALGDRVFGNPSAVKTLNAITHPAILARTGKRLADAQREGLGWVIYEAALILENRAEAGLSSLICVVCPQEAQRERLMARSGLTADEAERRISAQTNDEVRRAKATWLIENDGDIEDLRRKAAALFEAIVERHGRPEA
jgi:dephospho-CoA kinase